MYLVSEVNVSDDIECNGNYTTTAFHALSYADQYGNAHTHTPSRSTACYIFHPVRQSVVKNESTGSYHVCACGIHWHADQTRNRPNRMVYITDPQLLKRHRLCTNLGVALAYPRDQEVSLLCHTVIVSTSDSSHSRQ